MEKNQTFYSDERLKENIRYINPRDINTSIYIPFKSFNFKDDEAKRECYGVIAQEVERFGLTNLLEKDENGHLGVDYISLLILRCAFYEKELSNLKFEYQDLKKEVEELKNKIK